jgi:hypothetical protein
MLHRISRLSTIPGKVCSIFSLTARILSSSLSAMEEMDLKPPVVWYYNDIANVFEFLPLGIVKLIGENTQLNGVAAAKIYIGLCSNKLGWNAKDPVKM